MPQKTDHVNIYDTVRLIQGFPPGKGSRMSRHVLPAGGAGLGSRFAPAGRDLVQDGLTGLVWPRSANLLGYPVTWPESLEAVAAWNRAGLFGHGDWRAPNRRELRSLVAHDAKNPALPGGHPFRDVFLGWYWTSTTKTAEPAYAWSVHFEGGRMFYGRKSDARLVWPVRGESEVLAATGQVACHDGSGSLATCAGSGQDGELRRGAVWPSPRFERTGLGQLDRLTGLIWAEPARLPEGPLVWAEALAFAAALDPGDGPAWRMPGINELESLADAGAADPAFPPGLRSLAGVEGYWSATTSFFDPAFAFVFYSRKGEVGVGFKEKRDFHVWPVRE